MTRTTNTTDTLVNALVNAHNVARRQVRDTRTDRRALLKGFLREM